MFTNDPVFLKWDSLEHLAGAVERSVHRRDLSEWHVNELNLAVVLRTVLLKLFRRFDETLRFFVDCQDRPLVVYAP